MRIDLTDVTFLMLVRLDSIERLENILCVTERFTHYFNTNIIVREADSYNNGVLKSLLNRQIRYDFIEDKDPVLYKTKHVNRMASSIITPYLAIWDADIIPDKKAIIECMKQLRNKEADVAYPYNGRCYDIPASIKSLYYKKRDTRFLFRHLNKMELLYFHSLVGGAVFVNSERYREAGMENEVHYGWGNDDFDRYYRFVNLGMNIHRTNCCLFHLHHPKTPNSSYRSMLHDRITKSELRKTMNRSKEKLP